MSLVRFRDLRMSNKARQCELAERGDSSSLKWEKSRFLEKLLGELGELVKARERFESGEREAFGEMCDEMADVVICLDLFAMDMGIDLGAAVTSKFNRRSVEWSVKTRLGEHEKAGELE